MESDRNPGGTRRRTLLGVAAGGMAGLVAGCRGQDGPRDPTTGPAVEHQTGVVSRPPGFLQMVALDVGGGAGRVVAGLADRIERVHSVGAGSVTVGVGASLFTAGADRPRLLTDMPAFPNDVLDEAWCHGDLLVQVGGSGADQVAAIAADLVTAAGDDARVRWRLDGFRAENGTTAAGRPSTRNLFGFREGSGNPDPSDAALMDRLVWTGADEPPWAAGGTYQVVRLIRFAVDLWDREPVPFQEAAIGRHQSDGAPLAGGAEDATIDYSGDPAGAVTPLGAHIRRANPQTAESRDHRILRRGYSYRRADDDQGLIFVCFQRDPENGFAAIQRRLAGETLDRYVLPFGGGYFFVPPSVSALAGMLGG
ncbi:Dyp-type peroxidase [Actinoplanes sp. NPDC020271]|uniref:Dyp-type peroxidase n=1 Tax=Actinoplanes sp. NPDC020271 TaxID=3363896 RepID=UPI0037A44D44